MSGTEQHRRKQQAKLRADFVCVEVVTSFACHSTPRSGMVLVRRHASSLPAPPPAKLQKPDPLPEIHAEQRDQLDPGN